MGRKDSEHLGGRSPFLTGAGEVSTDSSVPNIRAEVKWNSPSGQNVIRDTGVVSATNKFPDRVTQAATVVDYKKMLSGAYQVNFSDGSTITYTYKTIASGCSIDPVDYPSDDKSQRGAEWLFRTLCSAGLIGR